MFEQVTSSGNWVTIKSFPWLSFTKRIKKYYNTEKISNMIEYMGMGLAGTFSFAGRNKATIKVHKFFLPELVYLLEKFNYPHSLISVIVENTWLSIGDKPPPSRTVDMTIIQQSMDVKFHPYQEEFIQNYEEYKYKSQLNGFILSFEQGLGKTVTSLALMCGLRKKLVLIIAPKSTLLTVWEQQINQFFRYKKKILVNGRDQLSTDCEYILVNYEGIDKLQPMLGQLTKFGKDLGIIVDESHNFLRTSAGRTKSLIMLRETTGCTDMLMMSGTPIKALGVEVIPMLMILDKYMDEDSLVIFKKAFGVNTLIAVDILRARLGRMMYRKTKDEVLKLPPKTETTVKIKIPGADAYTIDAVKKGAMEFAENRKKYHDSRKKEYNQKFDEVMAYLKKTFKNDTAFNKYLNYIKFMRNVRVSTQNPDHMAIVKWCNEYERTTIIPILPANIKKSFEETRAAVKYVHLKIQGEVIGQYLSRLRIKMTSDLVANSGITDMIDSSIKKTVIFTSYVDTIEVTEKHLLKAGYNPILVYGKTTKDLKSIVDRFIKDEDVNPLVASIQTLATGVTLVVANTAIFLNRCWRWSDHDQSVARVHRIGQDTPVYIYILILDTGDKPNLSTRMDDIMEWSKTVFDAMVDGEDDEDDH